MPSHLAWGWGWGSPGPESAYVPAVLEISTGLPLHRPLALDEVQPPVL